MVLRVLTKQLPYPSPLTSVVASAVDIDPLDVFQINISIDGIRGFIYPDTVSSQVQISE
ncbi:hypothetical protein PGTUg99_002992 [Puccinia graminis f. sp. tritici]|uniref:Uncharacterized protein n=1 Tax=Puccinia graminis f. sp. tritici TaxID=56615 RepID=A0A5B0PVS4_PUCGR|nr:hypothetical protein PGTUg99_002992 [Puccinia graminis f. sp. tritici]